ncbi:post-transcriptional regulator [Candidatus Stoquefichus massiliensis]|uniref:post-transcriptional regulator n=1 Tax=Candidatus Stoquefichus massiliensis TaxID=1470350 RepID=UPI0004814063|nr:post-transcriptional regulator [Candidatus Stoquefichus massiliensis]
MEINLKNNLPLDILFLMRIKANEFKTEGVHDINAQDIKEYLYQIKWKNTETLSMCDVINDIMSLRFSEVFDYLKLKVIKEATSLNLDDFSELIAK